MQTARGVLPVKQIWLDFGQSNACESRRMAKCIGRHCRWSIIDPRQPPLATPNDLLLRVPPSASSFFAFSGRGFPTNSLLAQG